MSLPGPAPDGGKKNLSGQLIRHLLQCKFIPIMVGKSSGSHDIQMLILGKNMGDLQSIVRILWPHTNKIDRPVLIKTINTQFHPSGTETFLPHFIGRVHVSHYHIRFDKTALFQPEWFIHLVHIPHQGNRDRGIDLEVPVLCRQHQFFLWTQIAEDPVRTNGIQLLRR